MSYYVQNFSNKQDVISNYSAPDEALKGAKVLLAWYGYGDYCGSSLVIFEKKGTLFEVNGSHCSCNGLEGQWQPEETSWEALAMRNLSDDSCEGSSEAHEKLQKLVKKHLKA